MLVSPRSSNQQTPMVPTEDTGEEQRDRLHDSSDSAVSSRERRSLESDDQMSANDQQITKDLGVDATTATCGTDSDEMKESHGADGDTATCATGSDEGDKAGDGNETHSEGDEGDATLIEGSPPSSVQNDTNQSPNVGKPTRK